MTLMTYQSQHSSTAVDHDSDATRVKSKSISTEVHLSHIKESKQIFG